MKETYVSFQTAEMLRDRWFPINEFLENKIGCFKGIPVSRITEEMIEEKMLSCIPQSVVMKWLRDVHKLHITIFSQSQESWMYRITRPGQRLEEGAYGEDFYSYEEAAEGAIRHCLDKRIAKRYAWTNEFQDVREKRKYKVITLCGSTRFKDCFEEMNRKLTLEGNIVISVGCYGHAGDAFSDEQKVMLDDIHKAKIDMADEIFVINKGGYIGSSTRSEIEYAESQGKPVRYYYQQPKYEDMCVSEETMQLLKKAGYQGDYKMMTVLDWLGSEKNLYLNLKKVTENGHWSNMFVCVIDKSSGIKSKYLIKKEFSYIEGQYMGFTAEDVMDDGIRTCLSEM